jgi:hypothetical protein
MGVLLVRTQRTKNATVSSVDPRNIDQPEGRTFILMFFLSSLGSPRVTEFATLLLTTPTATTSTLQHAYPWPLLDWDRREPGRVESFI